MKAVNQPAWTTSPERVTPGHCQTDALTALSEAGSGGLTAQQCGRPGRVTLEDVTDVIFDDVVETDYGQFDMLWGEDWGFDGEWDRVFQGQVNGLAGAASEDGLYVNLARRSGGSPVQIVRHDAEPPLLQEWEDVVEVSISVPQDAQPTWSTWAGEDSGPLPIPHGTYRVRVNASGRDAGRDGEFAERPVDQYLIELWPAPPAPDAILRTTSADAAYWHSEVGSRR